MSLRSHSNTESASPFFIDLFPHTFGFAFLCVFEDQSMRRDFSEAPRSPSILPFNQRVFPSRSILFSLHPLISFPPNTLIYHSLLLSPLSLSLSHRSLSLSSFLFPLPLRQVPGQLHGRRQGRLHERKPPQRHAHHHPSQEVHGAHAHHLPPGQEAQAGLPSAHGGGRGVGQPAGGGRTGRGSVPRVGRWGFSFSL